LPPQLESRLARLESECARLAALASQLQGVVQGLLARGKPLGIPTASVPESLRREVSSAVEEAYRGALAGSEAIQNAARWKAALYNRLLAAALTGDRFELDAYLQSARDREEAPARVAAKEAAGQAAAEAAEQRRLAVLEAHYGVRPTA